MTEERSKRREFLSLVFIVNCFKKPLLIRVYNLRNICWNTFSVYLPNVDNKSCLTQH